MKILSHMIIIIIFFVFRRNCPAVRSCRTYFSTVIRAGKRRNGCSCGSCSCGNCGSFHCDDRIDVGNTIKMSWKCNPDWHMAGTAYDKKMQTEHTITVVNTINMAATDINLLLYLSISKILQTDSNHISTAPCALVALLGNLMHPPYKIFFHNRSRVMPRIAMIFLRSSKH